jgi:hypothetical protein
MNQTRKTAAVVGVLFLASYAGLFIGNGLYGAVINAPDYLLNLQPIQTRLITGVLLELINDAAVIGIAVLLFPLLKKQSEGLALGYVCFRVVEVVTLVISKMGTLSLLTLSREYLAAGAPDAAYFRALDALVQAERSWSGTLTAVFFILGALILYALLYRAKLVPRFISVWGLLAVAALITANLLAVPDLTQGFHPAMLLYFPIVLNELFLALWLIVKGFTPATGE